MIWWFDFLLLILILVFALLALNTKDLVAATMLLGAFSFTICLIWAELGAVDVAFTEAAVGAGVSTVYLIATIINTKRWSSD